MELEKTEKRYRAMGEKATRWFFVAIVIIVIFFVGVAVGYNSYPEVDKVAGLENKEQGMPEKVDFAIFWKAWNTLSDMYVSATGTPVSNQEKVYGAIQGLANAYGDPYTVFFPPAESKEFEEEISGNFEGVGMEVGLRDDMIVVIAPLKGTPADKAGVLSGDRILQIDERSTQGFTVDEAVNAIRGKKGESVTLTLAREGRDVPFQITIVRDVIKIPTINTEKHESGVYIISVYNFSANVTSQFRQALKDFVASGTNKLVIDLRGNPGGYLEAAVDMASWFLPEGKVVVREDKGGGKEEVVLRSKGYGIFNTDVMEVVVLIDRGTASASEILAGALSEHGIATLIGANTYGKGSVQELVRITSDTSLKVTVAQWLTPNGISISEGGLKPDIEVLLTPEDFEAGRDAQLERAIELLTGEERSEGGE